MKFLVITFGLMLFLSVNGFSQNRSVYTNLNGKGCRTIAADPSGAGSYHGRCVGIAGYNLDVLEGDIRQTINVVTPSRKSFELGFWTFFGSFSAVGSKAEWRMKGKVPVGLIVRFNIAGLEDSSKSTSYLMVSKITKGEICVTDIVKPSKTQNAEAQALADTAATRPCKSVE